MIKTEQYKTVQCENGCQCARLTNEESRFWRHWRLIHSAVPIPKSFSLASRRSSSSIISILAQNVRYRRILHGGYNVLLEENTAHLYQYWEFFWKRIFHVIISPAICHSWVNVQKPLLMSNIILTSTRAWSRRCVRGPKGHPSSGDSCWDSDFFRRESTSTADTHKDEY